MYTAKKEGQLSPRMPEWLTRKVTEVLTGQKGPFHKWKFFPNEEN